MNRTQLVLEARDRGSHILAPAHVSDHRDCFPAFLSNLAREFFNVIGMPRH